MKDNKAESLKKRLVGDSLCTWIVAGIVGIVAISDVCTAAERLMNSGTVEKIYTESPALLMGTGIRNVILTVVCVLLAIILTSIKKDGKPFSKANYLRLRAMAVLIGCCCVVPMVVASIAGFFDSQATFQLTLEMKDMWFFVACAVIGIFSEIFYYGYELQEDMDSIA